ncbi:hypothetical protein MDMS009_377 [Methylophaga thiooxydans DMS010]|uniref:Uncharacterized protein n=1 Tax=Methylophaga thiooxydans DMS010 TaxID=637616 RepID=C0N2I4_9GAMM|nr:hypothetical protein MDMS009_2992 [Methylophaga thiooxydans DMS010]EEF78783.1 hypothetical protein MDMS009_2527 [Methylophaga thiooxydans DMS010]EEF78967.1 hypothetical protein MDMS009_2484 [Methylophaga thiooxydans DMS010]EEF79030.1 hypothetical protein MDMS009_2290 [Methylophaga thiooxydans DMS010]EEF79696.1 hypothetical protein MDMS009_1634 [Methylophaga thiooxydans DMS010]
MRVGFVAAYGRLWYSMHWSLGIAPTTGHCTLPDINLPSMSACSRSVLPGYLLLMTWLITVGEGKPSFCLRTAATLACDVFSHSVLSTCFQSLICCHPFLSECGYKFLHDEQRHLLGLQPRSGLDYLWYQAHSRQRHHR